MLFVIRFFSKILSNSFDPVQTLRFGSNLVAKVSKDTRTMPRRISSVYLFCLLEVDSREISGLISPEKSVVEILCFKG